MFTLLHKDPCSDSLSYLYKNRSQMLFLLRVVQQQMLEFALFVSLTSGILLSLAFFFSLLVVNA